MTDEEWNQLHHDQCVENLRADLAGVLQPHFMMLGTPGFLTSDDVAQELTAVMTFVLVTPDDDLRSAATSADISGTPPKATAG